jgi:hypothetical protein
MTAPQPSAPACRLQVIDHGQPLGEHDALWRYMKLSTFLLLLDGKAFLPSVATLQASDPMEGEILEGLGYWCGLESRLLELPEAEREELVAWLHAQEDYGQQHLRELNPDNGDVSTYNHAHVFAREIARRRAVWCWFQAEGESAAMWSTYGTAGVAVQTTLADLRQALPGSFDAGYARVRYVNRQSPESVGEWERLGHVTLRPYLLKPVFYSLK